MVWKIFFVIFAILIMLMNIIGFNSNYSSFTSIQYLVSVLININISFILGIFYSLGWKQQIFSKKVTNILLTLLLLIMVLTTVISAYSAYPIVYAQVQNSTAAMLGSIISILNTIIKQHMLLLVVL